MDFAVDLAKKLASMGLDTSIQLREQEGGHITATISAKLGWLDFEKLRELLAFADELKGRDVKVDLTDGELGVRLS